LYPPKGQWLLQAPTHTSSSKCCSYQKDKWTKPGNLPTSHVLSEIWQRWIEKNFHLTSKDVMWLHFHAFLQHAAPELMLKCAERKVIRRNVSSVTDRQRDRQADRYEHLNLHILIIPSFPHVNVPEKQEIENRTPISQLRRMKYACGLCLSAAQLILYSQPPGNKPAY